MRKKKTLIVALCLLVAVAVLGVGYALTDQNLVLTGTATIGVSDDFHPHFSAAECKAVANGATQRCTGATIGAAATNGGSVTATMAVEMNEKDQTATATFTLKNFSQTLSANFATANVVVAETANGDYFSTTTAEAIQTIVRGFGTVAANTEAGSFDVTVTLDKENITAEALTGTFTVTISNITAVQPTS